MKLNIKIVDSGNVERVFSVNRYGKQNQPIPNAPTVLIVTGSGVLSKTMDDTSQRIVSNPDLLWQRDGNIITFTRRETVEKAVGELEKNLFFVITPTCDEATIEQCVNLFYKKYYRIKNILKNGLLQHSLYLQLRAVVLVVLFLMSVVNYFVFDSLANRNARLTEELRVKKMAVDKRQRQGVENQLLANYFSGDRKVTGSEMCDCVFSSVPKSVTLENFDVDPLRRRIESGREVECDRNKLEINGIVSRVSDLPLWVTELEKMTFLRDVKILAIERDERQGVNRFGLEATICDK